jgi:hypothetical protein
MNADIINQRKSAVLKLIAGAKAVIDSQGVTRSSLVNILARLQELAAKRQYWDADSYPSIGYPRGDKADKVLVLAHSGEVGQEIDADECTPTGRSNLPRGREYRLRYFRHHPRGLEGNPRPDI